jgi:pyrrolidone-carboxylate peptidase
MAGVLITGFEPFGGEAVNPSWEVVKQLDGAIIGGQRWRAAAALRLWRGPDGAERGAG